MKFNHPLSTPLLKFLGDHTQHVYSSSNQNKIIKKKKIPEKERELLSSCSSLLEASGSAFPFLFSLLIYQKKSHYFVKFKNSTILT
jgi:hypothetical protein